jgi:hypothetical protein
MVLSPIQQRLGYIRLFLGRITRWRGEVVAATAERITASEMIIAAKPVFGSVEKHAH